MTATRFSNTARYWRTPLLPGADMLTAEYYDHEFTPHWHDAYTIPVIEEGAECYDYRGSKYVAEAGSVPIINPGELHTGARAMDVGWRYRVFYLPVEFVQSVANEVAGRAQPTPWFPPISSATPMSPGACSGRIRRWKGWRSWNLAATRSRRSTRFSMQYPRCSCGMRGNARRLRICGSIQPAWNR